MKIEEVDVPICMNIIHFEKDHSETWCIWFCVKALSPNDWFQQDLAKYQMSYHTKLFFMPMIKLYKKLFK